ncbi:MAG: hypothetical protein RQ739_16965 [Desulfotignum sp.]|nr:hypothetical protein [Desulfotignum sp.]
MPTLDQFLGICRYTLFATCLFLRLTASPCVFGLSIKHPQIMVIADASGFPVAACVESASPHEVKLVEKTIDSSFTPYAPDKLIGDKAYDSDPLDQKKIRRWLKSKSISKNVTAV